MSNLRHVTLGAVGLALLVIHGASQAAPDPLVTQGEQLYIQNCQVCHQADAIGKPGFAPSLTNQELLATASDKFLLTTIRDGRPGTGMPPFSHLGKDGIEAVVAYLRGHATGPNRSAKVDAQPPAKGDAARGEPLFHEICSTCHGNKGDGYIDGGTGTAIGKAGFLEKASDGFIRTTIKNGRTQTRMLGFQGASGLANLDDQQIDDLIVYLRSIRH